MVPRYRHKYQDTSHRLTGFFTLMSHWRGSVMKLIYHNLIIFILLYFLISFVYRFQFLNPGSEYHREVFELICIYSSRFQSYIPLQFLIGFYVQQVGSSMAPWSRWFPAGGTLSVPSRSLTNSRSSLSGALVLIAHLSFFLAVSFPARTLSSETCGGQ